MEEAYWAASPLQTQHELFPVDANGNVQPAEALQAALMGDLETPRRIKHAAWSGAIKHAWPGASAVAPSNLLAVHTDRATDVSRRRPVSFETTTLGQYSTGREERSVSDF